MFFNSINIFTRFIASFNVSMWIKFSLIVFLFSEAPKNLHKFFDPDKYPAGNAFSELKNILLARFMDSPCGKGTAIITNQKADDVTHPLETENIVFCSTEDGSIIYMHE